MKEAVRDVAFCLRKLADNFEHEGQMYLCVGETRLETRCGGYHVVYDSDGTKNDFTDLLMAINYLRQINGWNTSKV